MTLDPSVAAVRLAVRRVLGEVAHPGETVLVACSGGADSLALLAATVVEAATESLRVVGVVVDHGLQEGSAEHTTRVVGRMALLGVDETASIRVSVDAGGQGTESAARQARYAALGRLAEHFSARACLLGHTLDDQAETVLLGLTRGSGARSLAGMRPSFDGLFHRPLLGVSRSQTEAACAAEEIEVWTDPHNSDPRFVRARVRHDVLPVLERELGPGVAVSLARTADQLRTDTAYLDDVAEVALESARDGEGLVVVRLETLHEAVRTRVLRLAALAAGARAAELSRVHVHELDRLVTDWHGQRAVRLPGHVTAHRDDGVIGFGPTTVEGVTER